TFVAMNNTRDRSAIALIRQRRLVSTFGQAQFDYKNYLYATVTGRNDWTSTIPTVRNSFFYPSVQGSFVFSDAFPSIGRFMQGKLRAAWAQVGKDAKPYAYAPSLESKPSSYRGYGYGFTGPNPNLKPEFAIGTEIGTELGFLDGRLGVDVALYRKETRDQIVDNVRASYGSGFILINLNGATTESKGLELTLRGIPIQKRDFSWDVQANFTRNESKVLSLPDDLPEYYSSDTWLIGNVRNGVKAGSSTMGLFGLWYLHNQAGDILIDPGTGLPIRDSNFTAGPYDRNPDFLIGLSNTVQFKRFTLSALLDIRKGGDVFNATEWWLTQRGLSERTLDRWEPRVVKGVLRDGLENTANPTKNTIVVTPALNTNYYLAMSEELFIEEDINWIRLRDVTLSYALPTGMLGLRNANVYVTGTELFLITNYSGMDPIVNGNTAATGGSGGIGIDYGNFPMPLGINFGVRVGF
ncbi:MAG TPA: TonB-dependent receptor, partial [Longimicrobiales bacterium]